MRSDRHYHWLLKALYTCADSNSMYIAIIYFRGPEEGKYTSCKVKLEGVITTDSDYACIAKLGYIDKHFKRNFPNPTELADTLELFGVLVEPVLEHLGDDSGSYSLRVQTADRGWQIGGNVTIR